MKKGYTLIEILVTLTIVGLIFSLGFVSFREFSQRQAVVAAARRIKADLRLAQEQALAGNKPPGAPCDSPNVLNGYNFKVVSPQTYEIEANCSAGAVRVKSVSISPEISMSIPSPNPITFKVLGQGTNVSGSTTISLTQAGTNYTQTLTVTSVGEIK